MADIKTSKPTVDREKTCPFLLRTFVRQGSFHPLTLFDASLPPPSDEYALYTWRDTTLKELALLLRGAVAEGAGKSALARWSFRVVFPDQRGRVGSRELGFVHARELGSWKTEEGEKEKEGEEPSSAAREKRLNLTPDDRTLEELRVVPGDILSVAVLTPHTGRQASGGVGRGAGRGTGMVQGVRGAEPWAGLGGGRGADQASWRGGRGGPGAAVGRGVGRGVGKEDERRMGRRGDREFEREREREERPRDRADYGREPERDTDFGRPGKERDTEREHGISPTRELDYGRDRERERERERDREPAYGRRAPLPRRERDDVDMDDDRRDRRDQSRERERDGGRKRRRSPSYSPVRRDSTSLSKSRSPRKDSRD
ncbi:hypothetical protein DACRYDRAFT_98009 [Dacryopinax primogenitus]|uniref:SAP18-domain-containing protein n=1 Tax=Dacryopinax primogenitus (strain DJM 731) TaxID=1858805 RepID=M5GFX5_DACPD|nr:uncharacterized protein DACRYDRAFT_98009 [Dacryopinax primogenitus]EJU06657.1 hypothetical protein DACRYDRAFT_98009 [Dacryopinax primogenitus]